MPSPALQFFHRHLLLVLMKIWMLIWARQPGQRTLSSSTPLTTIVRSVGSITVVSTSSTIGFIPSARIHLPAAGTGRHSARLISRVMTHNVEDCWGRSLSSLLPSSSGLSLSLFLFSSTNKTIHSFVPRTNILLHNKRRYTKGCTDPKHLRKHGEVNSVKIKA